MEGQDNNPNNANTGANNEPAGANNQNAGTNNNPVTFDDFLKDGKNQAEFDRRVQKAIQTAQEGWKAKNDAEKSEAERLAQMNETEKLQYQLQKQQKDYEAMQKKLNARDLKDEALKIATTQDTAFDPEFLNLFDYESMTAEQLQEKTKLIKSIQDRIVEKAVNEWSKEKPPYNPNPSSNKPSADEAIRRAMGLK
nr:MAG TPA: capsid scaffolding protein [Caudoviricetes sp.]